MEGTSAATVTATTWEPRGGAPVITASPGNTVGPHGNTHTSGAMGTSTHLLRRGTTPALARQTTGSHIVTPTEGTTVVPFTYVTERTGQPINHALEAWSPVGVVVVVILLALACAAALMVYYSCRHRGDYLTKEEDDEEESMGSFSSLPKERDVPDED